MLRWGLELPNKVEVTTDERGRAEALRPRCLKIRQYHPREVVDWGLSLRPDMLFLVRPNVDGELTVPHSTLAYLHEKGAHHILLMDSEPNHQDSRWRDDFDGYWEALSEVVHQVTWTWPQTELCWPPMAVQQGDLGWLARMAEAVPEFPYIMHRGAHLYWQFDNVTSLDWGRRIERYAEVIPDAQWIVDEIGDSTPGKSAYEKATDHIDVLTYLHGRGDVEAACLFLSAGGTDDWREFFLPLEECQRIGAHMETLYKEDTMGNEISTYVQWAVGRLANNEDPRDVTAFLTHLRALGKDASAPYLYGLPFVEVRLGPLA